jgi:hypothetical protein
VLALSVLAVVLDGYQLASTTVGDYASLGDKAVLGSGTTFEVIGGILVAVAGFAASTLLVRRGSCRRSAASGRLADSARSTSMQGWVDPEVQGLASEMGVLTTVGAVGVALGWIAAVWLDGAIGGTTSGMRLVWLALVGILLGPVMTVSLWQALRGRRR